MKAGTLADARDQKCEQNMRLYARWDRERAAQAAQDRVDRVDDTVLAAHPEIGVLMRNGRKVFYVVRNGTCVEHSRPAFLLIETLRYSAAHA